MLLIRPNNERMTSPWVYTHDTQRMVTPVGNRVFFTSDLHFGHANIIHFCKRPFATVEEMDEVLIENWNRKVHRNDTVYILGDFAFRATKPASEYLSRLKGNKILIRGNHDVSWMKDPDSVAMLEAVHDILTVHQSDYQAVLCHYPMLSWPHLQRGAYMIYGHIHNNRDEDPCIAFGLSDKMLNAGVDVNRFEPVTLDEMIQNNKAFRATGVRPIM